MWIEIKIRKTKENRKTAHSKRGKRKETMISDKLVVCTILLLWMNVNLANSTLDSFFDNFCDNDDFPCDFDEKKCIKKEKRCDGIFDCKDNSDEDNCDSFLCRQPNYFRCNNQICISSSFVCDSENDCGDFSDEKNCSSFKISSNQNCTNDEWMCKDRLCISKEWVCNGEEDCLDGSDETLGCSIQLKCDGFHCHDGHCIPIEWHCDGNPDCIDGSDELSCDLITEPKDCTVDNRKFLCKNNKTCIDMKLVCDEKSHCPDKSDEGPNCKASDMLCSMHNCSHECIETPSGPLCLCPKGYHQIADKHCTDINECEIYGICDQKCRNKEGSYQCYCDAKYKLQNDNRTCRANGGEALLLFSTKTEIRAYFLTSKLYYSVAKKLNQVVGVAFDGYHIYWTDIYAENEAIVRADEDGSNQQLLIKSGLGTPEDLAIDWITGNIYFTDAEMQHIGVCNNEGSKCTIIINEDIDKPRGIVLNPSAGEMFWSDWGKKPEIARSLMDGSDDMSFISTNIRWPNGLAIDYPNQRLYWVDAKLLTIESVLLDGTDRRVILSDVIKHPYAIAVFEDKLYWSDWGSNSIQFCDKFTGKNHHTLIKEKKQYIYGLHVFHSSLKQQRSNNPCRKSYCSDLCLLKRQTYACACPQDKTLSLDNHTCIQTEKVHVLAIAAGNLLMTVQHQKLGRHDVNVLPVIFNQINYLIYDSISNSLIINDIQQSQSKIISVNLKTHETQTLVDSGIGQIGGMDFDYFTNNLYWCDAKYETVEILSLTTMHRKTIMTNLAGEIPLDIALVPDEGVMFVALKKPDGSGIHIDRINMDGQTGRTHVVEQGLIGPINLIYDEILKRVYWCDSHTGNIESTSVDGDDRHTFRVLMTDPISIAILGKDLFWTNLKSRKIFWADKHNTALSFNKKITLDISKTIQTIYLTSISGIRTETHPCLINNGNCSHICMQSLKQSICACPLGQQILPSNNNTCFTPKHCQANEYKCNATDVCISHELRCNGKADCIQGDDEQNCVKEHRCATGSGLFECDNGQCIDGTMVCDLHFDCRDKSDEKNCNKEKPNNCPSGNFLCHDGSKCINDRLVCDNILDCYDGSDEENCRSITCGPFEFRCNSGECIPQSWECDGESDCQDRSDEHKLCSPKTCASNTFTCSNNRCISSELRCNFIDDCGDLSDELGCSKSESNNNVFECQDFEFLCNINSTLCLPETARCNGTVECPNGEDEIQCQSCLDNEFECSNKKCISRSWLCDKHDDCGDKSDEDPATVCNETVTNLTSNSHQSFYKQKIELPCVNGFKCKTGHCIDMNMVCNGIENCYDGSDEYGSCETACETNNNPCASVCLKTPFGPKCACENGYKLIGDAQTCEDINECEEQENQPCSQLCENQPGSFICSCFTGYELRSDRKSCKAIGKPMSIIFNSINEIRRLSPSTNTLDLIYAEEIPRMTGLHISMNTGDIYFSLEDVGIIRKISLKSNKKYNVVGLGKPQKLAVDWITNNVYFVDQSSKTIKACHIEEKKCAKVLQLNAHEQISSLVIDSVNKYMFYSTTSWWLFNSPVSTIYKCNLDGSNVHELVKNDLGYVTGLAFDYNKKKLYFSDQHLNQIQAVNYNGTNRFTVLSADSYVNHPLGLDLFEDHLYFLSPNGYLVKCKIYGIHRICSLVRLHASNTELFTIVQESKQPQLDNICLKHNCIHLCIQSEIGVQCLCEDGSPIEEGLTCATNIQTRENENDKLLFEVNHIRSVEFYKSSRGSVILAIIIVILIIICAVLIYKHLRSRSSGKFDVSMRFLNPTYGMQLPNSVPSNQSNQSTLQPGQHEYANPVLINSTDMETAANVILQKTKQNPFVLADSYNSDSESDNNKKLINL